jgi:hypothetical protein
MITMAKAKLGKVKTNPYLSESLMDRVNEYIKATYKNSYGKLSAVFELAVDAFLTREGY